MRSQFRSGDSATTRSGRTIRITRDGWRRSAIESLERARRVREKVQVGDADLGGGLPLLGLTDLRKRRQVDRRIGAPGRPVGHDAVGGVDALFRPRRHRAGGAEVDVVGMRRDDERILGASRTSGTGDTPQQDHRNDPARHGLVLREPSCARPVSRTAGSGSSGVATSASTSKVSFPTSTVTTDSRDEIVVPVSRVRRRSSLGGEHDEAVTVS